MTKFKVSDKVRFVKALDLNIPEKFFNMDLEISKVLDNDWYGIREYDAEFSLMRTNWFKGTALKLVEPELTNEQKIKELEAALKCGKRGIDMIYCKNCENWKSRFMTKCSAERNLLNTITGELEKYLPSEIEFEIDLDRENQDEIVWNRHKILNQGNDCKYFIQKEAPKPKPVKIGLFKKLLRSLKC